jgi:UDP-N-acetylglucosamine acyltransferase
MTLPRKGYASAVPETDQIQRTQLMNSIHPTTVIIGDVTLGERNTLGPFVTITGPVTIGDDNWIGAGATIGAPPEVRGFEHPRFAGDAAGNGVVIGNRNTIREYAQIHQGWKGTTTLGDDLFVMNQTYIAHDCVVGDGVTMASSVLLAGHVSVGAGANLGLGVTVHQRVRLGAGIMVGMGSVVTRDVPPFAKTFGNPARIRGVNSIGLQRGGMSANSIEALEAAYGTPVIDFASLVAVPELAKHFVSWN